MKKVCIIFLTLVIISVTALGFSGVLQTPDRQSQTRQTEFLRIHIRADSNDNAAQAVKYRVRDEVVAYLTPIVASCESKAEAAIELQARLSQIAAVASEVLNKQGFDYSATASLEKEDFPTRVYNGYTLPAGEYSALILRLGRGEGDNWWCVVYPPLCFVPANGENVIYKSKIKEIIERFYG